MNFFWVKTKKYRTNKQFIHVDCVGGAKIELSIRLLNFWKTILQIIFIFDKLAKKIKVTISLNYNQVVKIIDKERSKNGRKRKF